MHVQCINHVCTRAIGHRPHKGLFYTAPKSCKVDFLHRAFGKTAGIISYGYYHSIKNVNQKFQLTVLEKYIFCVLFQLHPGLGQLKPGCK
jgi:hypothetical protein